MLSFEHGKPSIFLKVPLLVAFPATSGRHLMAEAPSYEGFDVKNDDDRRVVDGYIEGYGREEVYKARRYINDLLEAKAKQTAAYDLYMYASNAKPPYNSIERQAELDYEASCDRYLKALDRAHEALTAS
jgi:hypothetical protein